MSLSLSPQDFQFGAAPLPSMAGGFSTDQIQAPSFSAPQLGSSGSGLGLNMGTANLALAGLQTLGSLWGAFQAQKLAKKQFSFTKDIMNTNLANQIKSYNTALSDRARSRGVMEGQTQQQVQQYVTDNSLSRHPG